MGTKKNNHTDPICFRCLESDFTWYFQWTFLKIKKRWQNKKNVKKVLKNVPWIKNVKKRFFYIYGINENAIVALQPSLSVVQGNNIRRYLMAVDVADCRCWSAMDAARNGVVMGEERRAPSGRKEWDRARGIIRSYRSRGDVEIKRFRVRRAQVLFVHRYHRQLLT